MPLALIEFGSCARHPNPDLWSSEVPAERKTAIRICRACPAVVVCAQWRDELPELARQGVILGGEFTTPQRHARQAS